MNLPEKWAVEITSQQDAERLQKLFPNASNGIYFDFKERLKRAPQRGVFEPICFSYTVHYGKNIWGWSGISFYNKQGYTTLTITELETLLNK